MDRTQLQSIINFIWGVADDLLRDKIHKTKYRDVILPMAVIRRLDSILEPTKEKVIENYNKYINFENKEFLASITGVPFYNYSNFTLKSLCNDPKNIRINFENYLDSFSPNVLEIITKFEFKNQLNKLEDANILFAVIERFCSPKINFSINPTLDDNGNVTQEGLSNLGMGYVFEELIRKFNEESNEGAGEHFTPRDIIKLMTYLVYLPVKDKLQSKIFLIYDNACGTGGMLTESKNFIIDKKGPIKSNAKIYLYGQESNSEIYAICKADMLIKGEDANRIKFGSTLSKNLFGEGSENLKFDFMLANPPYGKAWGEDQKLINAKNGGGL